MSSIYGSASGANVIYGKNNYGVAFSPAAAAAGCSNFPDSLTTSANGSVIGAVINTSDPKLGVGCISFDGVDDRINLGDSGSGISGTSAFSANVGTVTMWCRSSGSQDKTIFSWSDTNAQTALQIACSGTSLVGTLLIGNNFGWQVRKTGALTTDTWVWLAIVQDGTAVKYYVDNVEQTVFDDETDKSDWVTAAMDNCRAGCINEKGTGNNRFFDGEIDDIGIWDTVIDSTTRDFLWYDGTGRKISELGTVDSGTTCENIKAYYNADDLTNSTFVNNAIPT